MALQISNRPRAAEMSDNELRVLLQSPNIQNSPYGPALMAEAQRRQGGAMPPDQGQMPMAAGPGQPDLGLDPEMEAIADAVRSMFGKLGTPDLGQPGTPEYNEAAARRQARGEFLTMFPEGTQDWQIPQQTPIELIEKYRQGLGLPPRGALPGGKLPEELAGTPLYMRDFQVSDPAAPQGSELLESLMSAGQYVAEDLPGDAADTMQAMQDFFTNLGVSPEEVAALLSEHEGDFLSLDQAPEDTVPFGEPRSVGEVLMGAGQYITEDLPGDAADTMQAMQDFFTNLGVSPEELADVVPLGQQGLDKQVTQYIDEAPDFVGRLQGNPLMRSGQAYMDYVGQPFADWYREYLRRTLTDPIGALGDPIKALIEWPGLRGSGIEEGETVPAVEEDDNEFAPMSAGEEAELRRMAERAKEMFIESLPPEDAALAATVPADDLPIPEDIVERAIQEDQERLDSLRSTLAQLQTAPAAVDRPVAQQVQQLAKEAVEGATGEKPKRDIPEWALPLVLTGLTMMASDNPSLLGATGEGGLVGTQEFIRNQEARRQEEVQAQRDAERFQRETALKEMDIEGSLTERRMQEAGADRRTAAQIAADAPYKQALINKIDTEVAGLATQGKPEGNIHIKAMEIAGRLVAEMMAQGEPAQFGDVLEQVINAMEAYGVLGTGTGNQNIITRDQLGKR